MGMDVPSLAPDSISLGDVVINLGGKSYQNFQTNLNAPSLWSGYHPGDKIPVTVLREGRMQEKFYTLPVDILPLLGGRLLSQWFMAYMFYVAGLMGLWFIRPSGSQRTLFVLFNFLIATWFSASNFSGVHEFNGQYVLRAAFWLWLPVSWHFHWVFPRPLKKLPAWVMPVFYVISILMALAEAFQWVPVNTYFYSFLLAILGSLGLLLAHIVAQPDFRRLAGQARGLFAYLLIPIGVASILFVIRSTNSDYFSPLAFLGISALPGFYFFILFFQNNLLSRQRIARLYRLYNIITAVGIFLGIVYALFGPVFPETAPAFANYFTLVLIGLMLVNFIPLLVLPALAGPLAPDMEERGLKIRANRVAGTALYCFLLIILGSAVGEIFLQSIPEVFDFIVPTLWRW